MFLKFNTDKWGNTLIINTSLIINIVVKKEEIVITHGLDQWSSLTSKEDIAIMNEWLATQEII